MRNAVVRESSGIRTHMAGPRTYVWLRVFFTPLMWDVKGRLALFKGKVTCTATVWWTIERIWWQASAGMQCSHYFDLNSDETTR